MNPQQIPLGQGIALLFIAQALLFIPKLLSDVNQGTIHTPIDPSDVTVNLVGLPHHTDAHFG